MPSSGVVDRVQQCLSVLNRFFIAPAGAISLYAVTDAEKYHLHDRLNTTDIRRQSRQPLCPDSVASPGEIRNTSQTISHHGDGTALRGNESKILLAQIPYQQRETWGVQIMKAETILANVRRYQMIASMYRQTAAFRPSQSWSLLGQAKEWESRAISEMEDYFTCTAYVQAA